MRIPVLLGILAFAFPLLAQVSVSDEAPLTAVAYGLAPRAQTQPAVASNGTDYLVVWTDFRASGNAANSDAFATRVAADGTVLDPAGLALPATFVPEERPAVFWNGEKYVVVTGTPRFGFGLRAFEIDANGTVGPLQQLVQGEVSAPAIAWNGAAYLVSWAEEFGAGNVKARLFDRAFRPISEPVTLGVGAEPSAASHGSGFLVAWSNRTTFHLQYATLTATGAIAQPARDLAMTAAAPAVAFNGVDYAVAWTRTRVNVARIGTNGNVVRTVELPTAFEENTGNPVLLWNGTRWVVTWTESRFIAGAELDSLLDPLLGPRVIVERPQPAVRDIALAVSPAHSFIVWSDATLPMQEVDIHGTLARGITPETTFLVSLGEPAQLPLDVVATRVGVYGAVWLEGERKLMLGRLDAAGRPLGDAVFVADDVSEARIATDGATFAVAYTVQTQAFVSRYTLDGRLLGHHALNAATRTGSPLIASDGFSFFVVWVEGVPPLAEVRAARMRSDGSLANVAVIAPTVTTGRVYEPQSLVWNGSELVAAIGYRRDLFCGSRVCNTTTELVLHFVAANDSLNTRTPVTVATGGVMPVAQLAAGGGALGLVWIDGSNAFVRRFSNTGVAIDGPTLVGANAIDAALVWTGSRFVAFTDERDGELRDAGRVHVTPLDDPASPVSFPSMRHNFTESLAATAATGGGALVVYPRTIARNPDAHPEGSPRGFVRFVDRQRRRAAR